MKIGKYLFRLKENENCSVIKLLVINPKDEPIDPAQYIAALKILIEKIEGTNGKKDHNIFDDPEFEVH